MATSKPTKPSNLMPTHFADSGVKSNFSADLISNGFSADFEDILQGDNLNYMIDAIGKELDYLTTIVDYINSIGTKKVPYINENDKLDSTDINGLLPTQTGNNGKYLTTNGTTCSWSNDFRRIGEPIITLDFNYVLADNEVWLDGTGGDNHNGVVLTTGDWASLFAIYGWQYDTSYTNTSYFRLPNFNNRVIWGGSTPGYIDAGLPNIYGGGFACANGKVGSPFFRSGSIAGAATGTSGQDAQIFFNAALVNGIYGRSNTVQPPAIKAKVYTRYK